MPEGTDQSNPQFEIVTSGKSKKGSAKGLIIALVVILVLALSIVAGVALVNQQQLFQQKASGVSCPAAEACPVAGQGDTLMSCTGIASGSPEDISCSSPVNVGTVWSCGGRQYCCPSLGASWTTNLTLCSSPSPTATATLTPTPTATATASGSPTATASATARATATASATPRAIPVTGTDWPTYVGAGVGILVIIGSILLAL